MGDSNPAPPAPRAAALPPAPRPSRRSRAWLRGRARGWEPGGPGFESRCGRNRPPGGVPKARPCSSVSFHHQRRGGSDVVNRRHAPVTRGGRSPAGRGARSERRHGGGRPGEGGSGRGGGGLGYRYRVSRDPDRVSRGLGRALGVRALGPWAPGAGPGPPVPAPGLGVWASGPEGSGQGLGVRI